MKKIAIVIPTYNEKENIDELIKRIAELQLNNYRIFFIDDNSPDYTANQIKQYINTYPITLSERRSKQGLGSAYVLGFNIALEKQYELIIEMDADLSHAPEDIPKLIQAIEEGADLAIGSRKIQGGKIIGWSICRHIMSNGAMLVSKLFLKIPHHDITSGFRCYKREIFNTLNLNNISSGGYAFQEEMLYLIMKAGYKIKEIPVTFNDRKKGKSKLSKKDILEFFRLIIKLH